MRGRTPRGALTRNRFAISTSPASGRGNPSKKYFGDIVFDKPRPTGGERRIWADPRDSEKCQPHPSHSRSRSERRRLERLRSPARRKASRSLQWLLRLHFRDLPSCASNAKYFLETKYRSRRCSEKTYPTRQSRKLRALRGSA